MTLTPELKEAVEKAGNEPVRVEDPRPARSCRGRLLHRQEMSRGPRRVPGSALEIKPLQ